MESPTHYLINQNLIEKWEKLQNLLKFEVTLMNLSKTHINTSIETISKNVSEYYRKKIQTKEAYDYNNQNMYLTKNLKTSYNLPKYSLVEDSQNALENYYSLVENFFFSLKNDNNAMLFLIKNLKSEKHDEMIIFLSTFFYENPFNTSFDQEPLLEIICELIKEEINCLNTPTVTSFLDSNFIGSLLKSLSRRPDIKSYLAKVLGDLILDMENMSQQFMSLEMNRIAEWLKNKNQGQDDINALKSVNSINKNYTRMRGGSVLKKKIKFNKELCGVYIYDNLTHSKLIERNENKTGIPNGDTMADIKQSSELLLPPEIIDVDNYLLNRIPVTNPNYSVDITIDELQFRIETEGSSTFMKEYYQKQIEVMEKNKYTYGHFDNIIDELANCREDWLRILFEFKKNFEKLKFFFDKLLINLLENESIVPYSIKVICKAIDVLLEKKFPNISRIDKNSFISEFFVGKLIIPILTNPDYNGIISSSIISQSTRKNMMYLTKIIKKIFRGNFFNAQFEKAFTIFNVYLCEVIPSVNDFLEKIKKVKLSQQLEEIIYGKKNMTPNGKVEILNEQETKFIFNHNSVVFKYNDLMNILKTLKENEDKFLNKCKDNSCLLQNYKLVRDNEKDIVRILLKDTTVVKYYLLSKNDFNFSLIDDMLSKKKRFSFTNTPSQSQDNKEDIILARVKYCIKTILRNLNFINLSLNYTLQNSKSTIDFFNSLSKVVQLEDNSDHLSKDEIPLGWYCLYLQYNLNLLSLKYTEKDYELLYVELMDEVNSSINQLQKNQFLGMLEMKITCSDKIIDLISKDYFKTKQIEKFIKIYMFTSYYEIPVLLNPNNPKTGGVTVSKEKPKNANCKKFSDFLINFSALPQLVEDITSENQNNKINIVLADYLTIVKNEISTNKELANLFCEYLSSEEKITEIIDDIENEIIEKIYFNIYPMEQSKKDKEFYDKCMELKDITPEKMEIKSIYVNEKLWSIAICYINRIDIEKTPIKKLHCVEAAYKVLNNCINFCSGKNEGAGFDDIFPIFCYIIIKSHPKRLFSNLNFTKALMNPNKLLNTYGFAYMQIEMATNYIMTLKL